MRKLVIILYLLIFTLAFSVSPKAYSYYTAAMSAMQMKDCGAALQWFEKALLEDPAIEDVDPYVKLWMGVCAYEVKNYTKARDFLKLFPDNEIAKSILLRMERGLSPEEKEWDEIKELISQEKLSLKGFTIGSTPPTSTATSANENGGKSSFLVFTGLFIVIFSGMMILELKYGVIAGVLAKIPRVRIIVGNAEIVKEVVHETMEKPQEEEKEEEEEEKEVEIDIEELFNTPLDTVDKLIYGEDFVPEVKEEKEEEEGKSEMEMVTQKLGSVGSLEEEGSEEESVQEKEEKEAELEEEVEEVKEEGTSEEKEEEEEEEEIEKESESEIEPEEQETITEAQEESETEKPSGESLTDEDVSEVEKRVKELLEEEEEEEAGIPVELAGMDAEDILNELEEKDEYDEEDADKLLLAIQKLIGGDEEGEKNGEDES